MEVNIKVDTKEVARLGFDFRRIAEVGLSRVTERAVRLLRQEVPKVTHNLEQGISADVNAARLTATLNIAARRGRVGREGGLLHLQSGETREVTLKAQKAFDYAEAVARGTGIYGPRHAVIRARGGKALLVPVSAVPLKNGKPEAYIESNGQKYIVRRFIKGRPANPFDVRAAEQLEKEIQPIFDRVVEAFASQEKSF